MVIIVYLLPYTIFVERKQLFSANGDKYSILMLLKCFTKGLFTFLLLLTLACSTQNSVTDEVPEDTGADAALSEPTTEAEVALINPIILVDPVATTENSAQISGILWVDSNVTAFSYQLNEDESVNLTEDLGTDFSFAFTLADLSVGTHSLSFSVTDNQGLSATKTTSFEITEPETEEPIADETPWSWQDITDVLNGITQSYEDLTNLIDFLQENEDDLAALAEFLEAWDGSAGSLQDWWNDWANSGSKFDFDRGLGNKQPDQTTANTWDMDHVQVTINDIEKITETLGPDLVNSLSDFTINDDFVALKNKRKLMGCKYTWKIKVKKTVADLKFKTSSIKELKFLSRYRLSVKLDLPNAKMTSNVTFIGDAPSKCIFGDTSRNGKSTGKGLSGKMILDIEYDQATKQLQVVGIDSSDLEVDSVSASMDSAKGIFKKILDWFVKNVYGCVTCSKEKREKEFFKHVFEISSNSPYKKMFNKIVQGSSPIRQNLRDEINKILETSLEFEAALPEHLFPDGQVVTSLQSVQTNESDNTLKSIWNIAVDTGENRDSCAHFLKPQGFAAPQSATDLGDFTLQLPYSEISETLVGVGRTGVFCFEEEWVSDGLTIAQFEFQPYGTLAVTEGHVADLDITLPFRVAVIWGSGDPDRKISKATRQYVYGSLTLETVLASNCDSGVNLSIVDVELEDLEGTLKLGETEISVTEIAPQIEFLATGIDVSDLQNIPLIDKVLEIPDTDDFALLIEDNFITTNTDIQLGLSLGDPDDCTEPTASRTNQRRRKTRF